MRVLTLCLALLAAASNAAGWMSYPGNGRVVITDAEFNVHTRTLSASRNVIAEIAPRRLPGASWSYSTSHTWAGNTDSIVHAWTGDFTGGLTESLTVDAQGLPVSRIRGAPEFVTIHRTGKVRQVRSRGCRPARFIGKS